MKRHKFSKTHIEIHDDGSATIHHVHESDPTKDFRHAVSDTDGIHASLEDHLNPDEMTEDQAEEQIHPGIHSEIIRKGFSE